MEDKSKLEVEGSILNIE